MSDVEVVALTGGIGGAKLALGLHRVLPPGALACVVNPGDALANGWPGVRLACVPHFQAR